MADILVFGASGTYGAWDIEGGWVQRLRKFIDRKNIVNLPNFTLTYNLGISGDTSGDVLSRFDVESKAYLKGKKARMIIFSVGVNDSRLINGKPAVSPEKFKGNITNLIKKAQKHAKNIVFIGLMPIHPAFVQWSKTETYNLKDIEKYNAIVASVCKENKIHLIEVFKKLIKLNYSELLEDELHYNTKGHQKIFEIIKNFLIKNKLF